MCALLCYIYTTTARAHDAHCTLTQASINCRLIPLNYKHDGYVVLSVLDYVPEFVKVMTSNGNKTECSPIRSVIIRVITNDKWGFFKTITIKVIVMIKYIILSSNHYL